MKPKQKFIKCYGGYMENSPFFKMEWDEFKEYCGGRLAVGLFKGQMPYELDAIIKMAFARGIKYQAEKKD